jgi:hypothetical protein
MAFLSCYMTNGVTFFTDRCNKVPIFGDRNDLINANMVKIANTLMLEESMKHYHASDIACAIVYIAREDLNIVPIWRRELTEMMRGLDPFSPLLSKLIRCIQRILASQPAEPASEPASVNITANNRSNDLMSPEGKENVKGFGHTSPVSVADHLETAHLLR